jgi:hypothetical protein
MLVWRSRLTGHPAQPVIWLLSHMRAGSTLLLHLLLTHPQIASNGERNQTYTSVLDLERLVADVRITTRCFWQPYRYVADQINHSRFTPNLALLNHPRVRVIFMVRKPAAALASLVQLTQNSPEPWPIKRAADYYSERLAALAQFGQTIHLPNQALFLTYEELIAQPTVKLARLQRFLALENGFATAYPLQRFTGQRGDPSPKIRLGQIVQPSPQEMELSPTLQKQVESAHDTCVKALQWFA